MDHFVPLIVRGLHTVLPNLGDCLDSLLQTPERSVRSPLDGGKQAAVHLSEYIRFERTSVPLVRNPGDLQTSWP
jgi:hypothetical protein